jgi:hypothetical protein
MNNCERYADNTSQGSNQELTKFKTERGETVWLSPVDIKRIHDDKEKDIRIADAVCHIQSAKLHEAAGLTRDECAEVFSEELARQFGKSYYDKTNETEQWHELIDNLVYNLHIAKKRLLAEFRNGEERASSLLQMHAFALYKAFQTVRDKQNAEITKIFLARKNGEDTTEYIFKLDTELWDIAIKEFFKTHKENATHA